MNRSAFTLVELLVVVTIIAIVSGISIFSVQGVRLSAQDDKRAADLRAIQSAFARYNADCFSYPLSWPAAGSTLTGDPSLSPSCASTNIYIRDFPEDPDPARSYYYEVTDFVGGKGISYILCAALTEDDDPTSDVSGCDGSTDCGDRACNVKLTN